MAQNTTGVDEVVRGAGSVEKRADAETTGSSTFWQAELQAAFDRDKKWSRKAAGTIELYRDDRRDTTLPGSGRAIQARNGQRLNILWSNTEILKASLYGTTPSPDIRRRWRDDDKVARQAGEMLERAVAYQMDSYDYDAESKAGVEDFVLPGRGVLRVNYEPKFDDDQTEIIRQDFTHSYVFWNDFRTSAGRRWRDKWWIAFRHQMSRDELTELLSKEGANSKADADKIPLTVSTKSETTRQPKSTKDTFNRAEVWEIWDKEKKQRVWIACDYEPILLSEDDPYALEKFYPAPDPITYISTTDRYEPVVPFQEYQDQAIELDKITTRLGRLIDALKYRGIYDASGDGNKDALANLGDVGDNTFVPHKNVAALLDKGGLQNTFLVMPIAEANAVVQSLREQRNQLVQEIMEITGISDIIRASSDPRETLGAQDLKANFANLRTRNPQEDVNQQQRGIVRLLAELIAEHIQPDILMEISGMKLPTRAEQQAAEIQAIRTEQLNKALQARPDLAQQFGEPQEPPEVPEVTIEDVMELLRSDRARSFRIGIETSVTGLHNQAKERADRNELVTTLQGLLEVALPAMQANPTIRPLLKEMVLFSVRGFEQGRQLEEALEDTFDDIEQMPPPEQEADTAGAALMAEVQRKTAKDQADIQLEAKKLQQEGQSDAMDTRNDAEQNQIARDKNAADAALKRRQLDITEQDNLADQQIERVKIVAETLMPEGEFGVN